MPRHKPSADQQSFLPLHEAAESERFALLISALTACGANEKVRSLVLLVHNMQKDGRGPLEWTLAEIGAEFHRSRDTARRWVQRSVELGLLTRESRKYHRGGQRTDRLSIDWEGVRAIACSPERTGTPPRPGWRKCHPGVAKPLPRGGSTATPYKEYNSLLNSSSNSPPPLPPNSPDTAPRRRTDPTSWEVVVEEVEQAGVDRAAAAVQLAKRHGASPADVRDVLSWWREHRGGFDHAEVVLYRRVRRCAPDLPTEKGWPKFREGYVTPADEGRRRVEAYWRNLERRHGATVLAWDEATKRAMSRSVVQQEPSLAGDGQGIFRRLCQYCETRALAPVADASGSQHFLQSPTPNP